MERLRDHMEAAIRERWHERPLAPAQRELPGNQYADALRSVRVPRSPASARASTIRAIAVSKATLVRNRLVAARADCPERDAYFDLQAAVLRRIDEQGLRVIGVTSPSRGSGKTLTSINLALSLAKSGGRPVMIVDCDLSAPRVHRMFDVDLEAGLEDHLFEQVPLADVLFSPSIDGVAVLPARGSISASAEFIRSGQLKKVLERIQPDHPDEILVLDLPSINSKSDGKVFEDLVDGIVLVVEDDVTEERDYRRALQSFSSRKLIGTVLNRVPSA